MKGYFMSVWCKMEKRILIGSLRGPYFALRVATRRSNFDKLLAAIKTLHERKNIIFVVVSFFIANLWTSLHNLETKQNSTMQYFLSKVIALVRRFP